MDVSALPLTGLVIPSLTSLMSDESTSNVFFIDLSLGAWSGHEAAKQLGYQFGISFNTLLQPELDIIKAWRNSGYSDTIARLIDTECIGLTNVRIAHENAAAICLQLAQFESFKIRVLLPIQYGLPFGSENLDLLVFLNRMLPPGTLELVSLKQSYENLPFKANIKWKHLAGTTVSGPVIPISIAAWPGLIKRTTLEQLVNHNQFKVNEHFWQIRNGWCIVDPIYRQLPNPDSPPPSELINFLPEPDRFQAYWYTFSGARGYEGIIRDETAKLFSEGAYDAANTMLEKARTATNDSLMRALLTLQLQGIRIALLEFKSASEEPIPEQGLPDELQAAIYQSIAWGLVMTGKASLGEPYFELARNKLKGKASVRDYLYLLNISALNKLNIGKLEEAFEFEKEIERSLRLMPDTDWHLVYINAINQARLYKIRREFDVSLQYYNLAFLTNDGLRQTSDLIYRNVCFAQLSDMEASREREVFVYWLKVSLLWLADEVPESLAPRVTKSITGFVYKEPEELVEAVSTAILNKLKINAVKIKGLDLESELNDFQKKAFTPAFFYTEKLQATEKNNYILGSTGWSVIVSSRILKDNKLHTPSYWQLKSYVTGLLSILCGEKLPKRDYCIFVDHQLGVDIPGTKSEVITVCSRLGINRAFFGSSYYELPKMVGPNEKARYVISAAVYKYEKVDEKLLVFYKRFNPPIILEESVSQVFLAAEEEVDIQYFMKTFPHISLQHLNFILSNLVDKKLFDFFVIG